MLCISCPTIRVDAAASTLIVIYKNTEVIYESTEVIYESTEVIYESTANPN
jgi:hypothetical protein